MTQRQVVKRAVRKLLVASAAIVGAVLLVRLLLVPGIEAVFHPGPSVTSLLRRAGIFLFVLLAYWASVRFHEKRAASELRIAPAGIALGGLAGAVLISITTLSLFALGSYEATVQRGPQGALWGVAGLIWVAAFLEEVVYRGVLFRILEESWGTSAALWLQALVFGVLHLANLDANAGALALVATFASVTLLGAFWASLYVYTRNLWVVSAHHAAWNFAIILSGAPLSGIEDWRSAAPVESVDHGPAWLTGGSFGPENSMLSIAIVGVSLFVLMRLARKRHRLVTGATAGMEMAQRARASQNSGTSGPGMSSETRA